MDLTVILFEKCFVILMYKIAVIGDKDSVLSFKAIGIDVFVSYEEKDARAKVDALAKKDYGVIYITEELAAKIPNTIERYNDKLLPAIIVIPSNKGTLGIGMKNLNKNVEKAVGANILGD